MPNIFQTYIDQVKAKAAAQGSPQAAAPPNALAQRLAGTSPAFQTAVRNLTGVQAPPAAAAPAAPQPGAPAPGAPQPMPGAAPVSNIFALRAGMGMPANGTMLPARPPMAAAPMPMRPGMPAAAQMPPPVQNAMAARMSAY
jgi:hypothetical protein